jgi:uncharacterized ferritin-like protein (DUF455 family)
MWAFETKNVFEKIKVLRQNADFALSNSIKVDVPFIPARDVEVLEFKLHPPKKGFSGKEGQARMLHDLASIELQAMELGLRTLAEFPEAPKEFKEELWRITLSESEHLEMCLTEIQMLGYNWGDWPVNCGLWTCVTPEDSLIDRLLIVHRYLEGSGLDAGDTLIKRLAGVDAISVQKAVQIINREEVGHVLFGSEWYFKLCNTEKIDPSDDFEMRMNRLRAVLPKRINPINHYLRKQSGFSESEIKYLEKLRESFLEKDSPFKK